MFKKIRNEPLAILALVLMLGVAVIAAKPGGMTGLTSLWVGDQTVTADVTPGANDVMITGTIEVNEAARFDGAIDANSTLNVEGAVTLQSTLAVTSATLTDATLIDPVITGAKITPSVTATVISTNIDASQTGQIIDNYGAATIVSFNLPAWALGLHYTFTVSTAESLAIVPQSTSRILRLTNATGCSISSVTVGDSVVLIATGVSTWVPREIGTWVDGR